MINTWWVTRPKRKLNSVPEVLSAFAEISLDQQWQGQRDTHLSMEEALEEGANDGRKSMKIGKSFITHAKNFMDVE